MRMLLTEKLLVANKRIQEFFERLNAFCRKYQHIKGLREAVDVMAAHYTEPQMLNVQQNVLAAKCFFEEDYPKELIHGIDLLFKGNGTALAGLRGPAEHIAITAILWIGENIKAHTMALEALIEMDAWNEVK